MSDFILKLWPKEQIKEIKRDLLESELKTHGLVSESVRHWSGKAFQATKEFRTFLDYDFEDDGKYSEPLIICIFENDYGIGTEKKIKKHLTETMWSQYMKVTVR